MAQLTNLNVAPYYDDFDENDRFHKVLFRPGYSIQARELTTLQSILQNQIQRHGQHMFKEGTVVIPGQVSFVDSYFSLKLSPTFANEQIKLKQYVNDINPVVITGETTGVKGKVLGYSPATTSSPPYLYGDILKAGGNGETIKFDNGENLSVNIATQHTTSYSADVASLRAAVEADPAFSVVQKGSAVTVEEGVYFIRGQFVRCQKQTLVLSPNTSRISARVGFLVLEKIETPENDSQLTDNSTGSSNYAAKGAHRLKMKLKLHKIPLTAPKPPNFVELIQLRGGLIVKKSETTQYSVIGDELARRTFDESGDYTTKPFTFKVEEQIDNDYRGRTYKGAYGVTTGSTVITDDNILANEALLNLKVSTGKAYVKGYSVEKISATNLTFSKARAFGTVNAGVSTFNVGNFVNVKNVYGQPDIGEISGETEPYREVGLYTDFTGTRGDASATGGNGNTTRGYQIGTARTRTMEYSSGTQGNTEAIYRLYLFDVRMLTRLTLSTGNASAISPSLFANHANGGVQIKGVTSGATAFVYKGVHPIFTNDPQILVTNVIGTFSINEKITVSDSAETDDILEDDNNTDLTIEQVDSFKFEEVRSVYMSDKDGDTGQNFSADCVLALVGEDGKILLDGTDENALDEFDQMISPDGSENVVFETQRVAKLIEPEKNISIFKMPKNTIKTLLTATNNEASDTQFTVRRQFIGTTNSAGVVSFSATGSNETFVAFQDKDYMCTVLTAGGGTAVAGDVILLTGKVTGTGGATLTITDNTLLGSAAKVKVVATILKTSVVSKTKTTNLCKQLKVLATDDDGAYGIRATDRDISLGRADVYKLIAVYDSEDTSTDATVPSMTLTSITGTFQRGEKIVGATSGAQARIITATSPMSYSLQGNVGAIDFVAGEVVTGASSKATATTGVLTAGSKVITSSFTLDTGQRDNYYDIARITRKKGAPIPLGRLHVVYDYMAHGSGDIFTVDSYSPKNGQMEYDNIPVYTATKVDPDAPEPTGTFPLRDCFDFRPTVEDIAGTSTTETDVDQITANSFNMHARQYDGTGAVVVDSPKPASSVQADFEFFLGYRGAVFLTRSGQFKFVHGIPAENPKPPKDTADALKLCTIIIPPFTFSPLEVKVTRLKTQRFTMRDIGRLKDRVERLEDLTSLNLLERSAESFEIQDQNGLNRFKSGFVVDNFKGHRVGAALNPDYKCAVDLIEGELRPKCVMRSVNLIESVTTDADRINAGYQKTGDLITLPYSEQAFLGQLSGSRIEYAQPFVQPSWVGIIELTPSGDDWFETEVAPNVNNSVMGDYDTVLAENENSLGTFWNAWEIVSQGVTTDSTQAWETSYSSDGYTEQLVQTSIDTTTINKKKTGVTNTLVEDIVYTTNTSITTQIIPFARSRKIKFKGQCFMPDIRLYPFFDGVDVSAFTEPLNENYTSEDIGTNTDLKGFKLVTDIAGKIEGFFTIPEHSFPGQENNPKFETQKELEFRLTSHQQNKKIGLGGVLIANASAGQVSYFAQGVLETTQDTITGTKNGKIVQTNESQTTSIEEQGTPYMTVLDSKYHHTSNNSSDDDSPWSPTPVFPGYVYQPPPPSGDNSSPSDTYGGCPVNDFGTDFGISGDAAPEWNQPNYEYAYTDTSTISGVYDASGWEKPYEGNDPYYHEPYSFSGNTFSGYTEDDLYDSDSSYDLYPGTTDPYAEAFQFGRGSGGVSGRGAGNYDSVPANPISGGYTEDTSSNKGNSGGGGFTATVNNVISSVADTVSTTVNNAISSAPCCFIMLEARYGDGTMDEVVRRYRDEYMTDRNRRGYYKLSEVFVPLMRKSKIFKWIVTKTFADPLVSYGKYYYGQNKHGIIYAPIKNFWIKVFDIVGGDTEFIRENGEIV